MLSFQVQPETLALVAAKYDYDKHGLEFGEFMSVCSYLLICNKLMNKLDTQRKGVITLDVKQLEELGMWFI